MLPTNSMPEVSLASRAMLCTLSICQWSARKHDPEASEEIAARHGDAVPWREMASRAYSLEQAGEALKAVERRDVLKALIAPNATGSAG